MGRELTNAPGRIADLPDGLQGWLAAMKRCLTRALGLKLVHAPNVPEAIDHHVQTVFSGVHELYRTWKADTEWQSPFINTGATVLIQTAQNHPVAVVAKAPSS